MVTASRRHLTERYAAGVDRLLWELEKRTMPDAESIRAVVAASAGKTVDALDIGAALVLMQAIRLEMDLLEADVLDTAKSGEVAAESVAAVLGLPDMEAVDARHESLRAKRDLPLALAGQVTPHPSPPRPPQEAAERASGRAKQAASRAAAAGRRREQLSRIHAVQGTSASRGTPASDGAPAGKDSFREQVDQASAYASEARVSAREAAERVALSLLRAAEALDRCAARCAEWEAMTAPGTSRQQLRRRAKEYAKAASDYRAMAGRYRDSGGEMA